MLTKSSQGYTITLKDSLYTDEAISQSIEAFKDIAPITFSHKDERYILELQDESQETALELCNYLIGLMRSA